MIGDLFDSPWKILIVALVIIVLFGSKRLPGAASWAAGPGGKPRRPLRRPSPAARPKRRR